MNTQSLLADAQIELIESLPSTLSLSERRQIRDFVNGVVQLRRDEVAAGWDLVQALRQVDYTLGQHRDHETAVFFSVQIVFENRMTAKAYRGDLASFKWWYYMEDSDYELDSTYDDVDEVWRNHCRFGFATNWDMQIKKFGEALSEYWGEGYNSDFDTAIKQTIQILCFPIFTERLARPLLDRWPQFSHQFSELTYTPRRLSEFGLDDYRPSDLFF